MTCTHQQQRGREGRGGGGGGEGRLGGGGDGGEGDGGLRVGEGAAAGRANADAALVRLGCLARALDGRGLSEGRRGQEGRGVVLGAFAGG